MLFIGLSCFPVGSTKQAGVKKYRLHWFSLNNQGSSPTLPSWISVDCILASSQENIHFTLRGSLRARMCLSVAVLGAGFCYTALSDFEFIDFLLYLTQGRKQKHWKHSFHSCILGPWALKCEAHRDEARRCFLVTRCLLYIPYAQQCWWY